MLILHTYLLCWVINVYSAMQTSAFSLFIPNTDMSAASLEFLHCSECVGTGSEGPACFLSAQNGVFLAVISTGTDNTELFSCIIVY